ncbi:MAG: YifB family Mg chelatase-like AAA ATPase [Candidatus Sericytochromatia bacterium]|nr:YifB family Mg chelatase-like AAA ATPase [Candidatus Sericytochromatia bacterium]
MVAKLVSGALEGIEAYMVEVEVDLANGLPHYAVVGLPDAAVQEGKERVRAALRNAGYEVPQRRITVNLAPADTRKQGPLYDLPIALGLLVASGQLRPAPDFSALLVGELALDGQVRAVRGVLALAMAARAAGLSAVLVPAANAQEAALVDGLQVYAVESLAHAAAVLASPTSECPLPGAVRAELISEPTIGLDMAEVKGQAIAKRALEIAAAGGHNVMLVGAPGSGKTMLARRLAGILPPLSYPEALELTRLYSIAGLLAQHRGIVSERPFRAPHHSVSCAGLIGGGPQPRPGEASLAHHGVLFLDELPEFRRDVIEQLRQPLEQGVVQLARAQAALAYPARLTLVAALNPCPCGFLGDRLQACRCAPGQAERYWNRLSGPLLDRLDLCAHVARLSEGELLDEKEAEPSQVIRQRVLAARARQRLRFESEPDVHCNAQMGPALLRRHTRLDDASKQLLRSAIRQLALTGRALDRVLKTSRTIADLAEREAIATEHVAEALQYRVFTPTA